MLIGCESMIFFFFLQIFYGMIWSWCSFHEVSVYWVNDDVAK